MTTILATVGRATFNDAPATGRTPSAIQHQDSGNDAINMKNGAVLTEKIPWAAQAVYERETALRGGVLADSMGGGKTVTALGLICHDVASAGAKKGPPTLVLAPKGVGRATWVALTNTRPLDDGFGGALDRAMWDAFATVEDWPDYDLFER